MPFSDLTSPYSALRVCVDHATPGHIAGQVYSARLTAPIEFSDLGALLLRLDQVLDAQNFPQAFQKGRSFSAKESRVPAADSPEHGMPQAEVETHRGDHATFVLYILSRRSSSWQGTVNWLDGEKPQEFSSALELMKLIEDRM